MVICVIVTHDVLNIQILKEKVFLTRMLQNYVLIEPGMVMYHLSDDYIFFRSTEWELGPLCSSSIPKVCSEFRLF